MAIISTLDAVAQTADFKIYNNNILGGVFTLNVSNSTVSLDALVGNITIDLAEHKANIATVQIWIDLVKFTFNPVDVHPSVTDQHFIKTALICRGNFTLGTYGFDTKYTKLNTQITKFSRLATVLTWGEFLYFVKFNNELLSKIVD